MNLSYSGAVHDNYRSKHREYWKLLHKFLNKLEMDKIKKLCVAAKSNEELFWKLLKGQCSTTQVNAFLIDGKLIRDWSLSMPRTGWKEFEGGVKIFKHIMLAYETNFRTVVGV